MAETPIDILAAGENPPMSYADFIDKIIETGVAGAREHYGEHSEKFRGSKAGFEDCRGKVPIDLTKLLKRVRQDAVEARLQGKSDYWYWRCREAEVEWVCNCVSAVLVSSGNEPIVPPTYRGMAHAQRILMRQV